MSEPSKLAKALIAVFLVFLLALLAEILFVVCRRRVSHQQDLSCTTSVDDHGGGNIFCCSKTQSRVEPIFGGLDEASEVLDDPIDVFKLRDMSRLLFTIEEEEEGKEDMESQKSVSSATSKCGRKNLTNSFDETVTLSELVLTIDEEKEDTFSTPCLSPSYFSPIASPAHSGHS